MNELTVRKIAILGGNPETGALVQIANSMGLHTVVLDPDPKSPAKKYACTSFDIDVFDLDAIDEKIREVKIEGVLVGVADPLVYFYQKICERNNFFCYANEKSIGALTSKKRFSEACRSHGITVTPFFEIDIRSKTQIASLDYPVVVKPVDSGAGAGISVCQKPGAFQFAVEKALKASPRKEIIIEKLMQCDDIFAYYTFVDGIAYISAIADRYKTAKQGNLSAVCIAAEYPSQHTDRFLQDVHPKLIHLFQNLGIQNGVLCIQFFVDKSNFYAYDPGFRLQGEAPHLYLKYINHFDHREMLLRFAMTGQMLTSDFRKLNDIKFKGMFATTIWVPLKAGTIKSVRGLDQIRARPDVIEVFQRLYPGETVSSDMLGTERQVFARIYTIANTRDASLNTINYIHRTLTVEDQSGEDMILDRYYKVAND